MSQFCVYRLPGGQLVIDLQSNLIDAGTRVVAPLIALLAGPKPLTRLEPVVDLDGVPYVLHTAEMAAVPAGMVRGAPVADCRDHEYAIRGALDMVFSGF